MDDPPSEFVEAENGGGDVIMASLAAAGTTDSDMGRQLDNANIHFFDNQS